MLSRCAIALAIIFASSAVLYAQVPFGPEFLVNSITTSDQASPDAAVAPNGTMMAVWEGPDGFGGGIFGRVFDPSGVPLGTDFVVNSSIALSHDVRPAISGDAAGRFVVVWSHYYGFGPGTDVEVRGQRFNSSGAPLGTEFMVNTYDTGFQGIFTDVSADAAGNFVVVWTSEYQDGYGDGVFGQRFDSTGLPAGTEFQVNTYTTYNQGSSQVGHQRALSVAKSVAGDFVVVWTSYQQDGYSDGVFGQRFTAAGTPAGTEFQVNTYTTYDQGGYGGPDVISTGSGSFVVVWESYYQDGDEFGVFAQRFDPSGPVGTEFQVNTYTTRGQTYGPRVTAEPGGEFTVVWSSAGQDSSAGAGIFGQRYDAAGAPSGTEFQVNTYTTGWQWFPAVAADWRGCENVVWRSGVKQIPTMCTVDTDCPKYPAETCIAGVCEAIGQQDGDQGGIFAQRYCDAPAIDHYKCYTVRDLNTPRFTTRTGISLVDQFISEIVAVKKIQLLCNPVDKNGEGILNPDAHLCCHGASGQTLSPAPHVIVADQFQPSELLARKGKFLCAPCTKEIVP